MADSLGGLKSKLEEMLKCHVCQDIFDEPQQLPCGHTFCKDCVDQMRSGPLLPFFNCPDCQIFFPPNCEIHKCYTLHSIVDDFKKTFQANQDVVVICDLCPAGTLQNRRRAVKTCLKCEVSLCDEHVRPHLVHPVFREHTLTEPPLDLSQIKCPEHKELVLKHYCPASKTYVCQVCAMEEKQIGHIVKASKVLEGKVKENVAEHFMTLEGKLQDSLGTVRKLREDIKNYKQQSQQTHSYFNEVTGVLLVLWLIAFFYACSSYVEYQTLSSTMQKQQAQLHDLFLRMSGAACFHPSLKHNEVPSRSAQPLDDLTLDVDSASPLLKVSYDLMSVERAESKQSLPEHPSRFDKAPQVLTTQCFSSGSHYWEVEVRGYWDIAVSYRSINRKVKDFFGYNNKSWSLTHKKGKLFAYHDKTQNEISKVLKRSRVAVAVDFQQGTITFSEVGVTLTQLHEFSVQLSQPVCLGFGLYRTDPPSRVSIVKRPPFPKIVN